MAIYSPQRRYARRPSLRLRRKEGWIVRDLLTPTLLRSSALSSPAAERGLEKIKKLPSLRRSRRAGQGVSEVQDDESSKVKNSPLCGAAGERGRG
jgi:hypothetical protein